MLYIIYTFNEGSTYFSCSGIEIAFNALVVSNN